MSDRRSGRRLASWVAPLLLAWGVAAPAQDPAAPPVGGLTSRYALHQRFVASAEPPAGSTGQFQVALRETVSTDDPRAKGPRTTRAVFSERPAAVSPVDERHVTDSVRHFTRVTIEPDPWVGRKDRRPLEDLTIWYRSEAEGAPEVLVLDPGRSLKDEEYRFAINYDFASGLAYLLPDEPTRVGETWKVSRAGAEALANDSVREGILNAKLTELRAHPDRPGERLAVVALAGKLVTGEAPDLRDTSVNARLEFAFTRPVIATPGGGVPSATAPAAAEDDVIDASGFVERLLLGQITSLRNEDGSKGATLKRDLVLECRRPGTDPPLSVPEAPPQATPANSWLTYADPKGRFHLRHPQEFQPTVPADVADAIDLVLHHPETLTGEFVRLVYVEKPKARPDELFKQNLEGWRKRGLEVIPGRTQSLPEAEWGGLAVNHAEAALTAPEAPGRPALRVYFDAYVIQFPRDVALVVSASTYEDQPEPFRAKVRDILKTVKLGTPQGP